MSPRLRPVPVLTSVVCTYTPGVDRCSTCAPQATTELVPLMILIAGAPTAAPVNVRVTEYRTHEVETDTVLVVPSVLVESSARNPMLAVPDDVLSHTLAVQVFEAAVPPDAVCRTLSVATPPAPIVSAFDEL